MLDGIVANRNLIKDPAIVHQYGAKWSYTHALDMRLLLLNEPDFFVSEEDRAHFVRLCNDFSAQAADQAAMSRASLLNRINPPAAPCLEEQGWAAWHAMQAMECLYQLLHNPPASPTIRRELEEQAIVHQECAAEYAAEARAHLTAKVQSGNPKALAFI